MTSTAQVATGTVIAKHKPFWQHLYFQVLAAIVIGVLLGHSTRPRARR